MKDNKILEILIFDGVGTHDFKMLFNLDNNKVLYFNSLWLHYFDSKDLQIKHKFKKIKFTPEIISQVLCFEGVGHYIKLESGIFINIYQEIRFIEDSPFKYTYGLTYPNQTDEYGEILNDIVELGDSDKVILNSPKHW